MMDIPEQWAKVLADHYLDPIDPDALHVDPADRSRYVLFERNAPCYEARTWVSFHENPEDAGHYALNQEGSEDWSPVALLDLQTGKVYIPQTIVWRDDSA